MAPSQEGHRGASAQDGHQPNPSFNQWEVLTAFGNVGGITRCQEEPSAIKGKENFKESVLFSHYTPFLFSQEQGSLPHVCLGWSNWRDDKKGFIVFRCVFQCVTTSVYIKMDQPISRRGSAAECQSGPRVWSGS